MGHHVQKRNISSSLEAFREQQKHQGRIVTPLTLKGFDAVDVPFMS